MAVVTTSGPDEASVWADNLPDSFLLCRDMGHTWRPRSATYDDKVRMYVRVMECGRCKTRRTQELDQSGGIVHAGYDYREGYLAPSGVGRINRDLRSSLRLESTLRLISRDER